MTDKAPLFSLLFIYLIAFITPIVASLVPILRIPTAVLEIFCGILIGKSGLQIISQPDWMHAITQVSLLYLMFLAGLEIRLTKGRSSQRSLWLISLISFITVFALSLVASHLLLFMHKTTQPMFTTIILSTTSLGVIIPVLREQQLIDQPLGQTLLMSALLADLVTVALSSFILQSPQVRQENPFVPIIAVTFLGTVIYLLGRFVLPSLAKRTQSLRSSEIGVRGALAIMAMCGATAIFFHAEVILGGFIGGLVCSSLAGSKHPMVREKLETIGYGYFLPFFFITVGIQLDMTHVSFGDVLSNLPLYLFFAILVKVGSALAFKPVFSWRDTMASGALLSTRFTLVLAVTMIAQQMRIISSTEAGTFMAMAMITVLIGPLMFTFIAIKNPRAKNT